MPGRARTRRSNLAAWWPTNMAVQGAPERMFGCVGKPLRESDGWRQSCQLAEPACYFGRTARSTILIHGLDNSSTAESVWWMVCQATQVA